MLDALSISIIIPVLNEAGLIAGRIAQLRALPDFDAKRHEVIVVDGGSEDGTLSIAQDSGADKVILSPRGRALQQNLGANSARGDMLLFMHADCQLQPGCLTSIEEAMKNEEVHAACFRQQIDHPGRMYRWLEAGNNQRVRWMQWAYGDQGICVRKSQFEQMGCFPVVPFLEDLLLSKKLSRNHRIHLLPSEIIVSPRRWQKSGIVRQTAKNWIIVVLAQCGVSPHWLARFYPQVR